MNVHCTSGAGTRPFITDLGRDRPRGLPRFGAWVWSDDLGAHRMADVSNRLDGLRARWRVPAAGIIPVPGAREGQ